MKNPPEEEMENETNQIEKTLLNSWEESETAKKCIILLLDGAFGEFQNWKQSRWREREKKEPKNFPNMISSGLFSITDDRWQESGSNCVVLFAFYPPPPSTFGLFVPSR